MSRKHRQRHLGKRTLGEGNWLRLEEVEYLDHNGTARTWEATVRRGPGSAAFMIARLVPSERYILVRQYRPPADGLVLEFPAGLLDPGEDPATTAVRELREETGYTGTITWAGPMALSSPGSSREGVCLLLMEVDEEAPENLHPEQACEESEDIEVILKRLDEIPAFLGACGGEGVHLDSRLVAYFLALGLRW